MIPQNMIELIHQEIDGANTPDESRQLQEYLSQDPTARQMYGELLTLAGMMARVPQAEASANVQKIVMNSIDPKRYHRRKNIGEYLYHKVNPDPHPSTQSKEDSMKSKVIFTGLGMAMAVVIYFAFVYPWPSPVESGTEGTIGAAKKYRSEQIGDKDVQLGDQSGSSTVA